MEHLIVRGGRRLNGELIIRSAKNSVLPLIACCIMSKEDILIKNCPKISDIFNMLSIIKSIGGKAEFSGDDIYINCREANPHLVDSNLTGGIRSSVFILGPVLSRFRSAVISYPGGCDIGLRPIDLHIKGLKSLNIAINEANGLILCDGEKLSGGNAHLDFPSVGATENIMMAGVLASGRTVISNAAREPEIVDLQNFINYLGGCVRGAGTDTVIIDGVEKLGGGEYAPISDRIVACTYLTACAMCGGNITLKNTDPDSFYAVTDKLERAGCEITPSQKSIAIKMSGRIKPIRKIETQPFPGFPTDMQAQISSMLSIADGSSIIVENLFENRFKYTRQLGLMGADITVKDRVAIIKGVKALSSANVRAEDLRGGAALVLAALAAEGASEIADIHHIDRGYYKMEDDLNALGADIRRTENML